MGNDWVFVSWKLTLSVHKNTDLKKKKIQEKCFSNQYDLILLNQRPIINKPNASNMFGRSEKIIAILLSTS